MNDFSVMGLVVDQFDETIDALTIMKRDVKVDDESTWVLFDGLDDMQSIFSELQNHEISFSVSDVVSCAYQG